MPFSPLAPAALFSSLLGGQQIAAPAPAITPPQAGGLGQGSDSLAARLAALSTKTPPNPLQEAISQPASEMLGSATAPISAMGPPEAQSEGGFGDKIGGFFGNLDQTLQSPSKTIGLGLLSRIDPRAGLAGLLASGLFGDKF